MPTPEGRYLTHEDKLLVLADWERDQRELMRPPGNLGGQGYADPEMVPWCAEINRLDGIVTLQSCCGHFMPAADDPSSTYIATGQLWLWLSERMANVVYRNLPDLASDHETIDEVRLLFGRGRGREILDITWRPDRFDTAVPVILEFLRDAHDVAEPAHWRTGPSIFDLWD